MLAETVERPAELAAGELVPPLRAALERVIVGQRELLDRLLVGLLANGHVLIEGVPGIGKTLAVTTLARALDAAYQRIQFTPDLLPADLIGTLVFEPQRGAFSVRKGPIFANFLLADEINRAPAKVQSALLEAMQEGQVTIGSETHLLPKPFLVLATQNPLEHEGTYPLPEAQLDRFMLKLVVRYPSREDELAILAAMASTRPRIEVPRVASTADVLAAQQAVDRVHLDDRLARYVVDLVLATRAPAAFGLDLAPWIEHGASPRATIYLALAAKALAFVRGRGHVTPHDVKSIAPDVLRHRVLTSYEAEVAGRSADDLVREILERLPVP